MGYNVKIKLNRSQEDGTTKRVTESYLVDALSCPEAEARLFEYLEDQDLEDTEVINVSKANYSDVITGMGDCFFKAKVSFVSLDETAGKERKVNNYMLIQADDFAQAFENLLIEFKSFTVPYDVHGITETNIIEYVEYLKD